ncbi:MAG: DUF2569 family protein [Proteobacteria bacterium]|nr:DUF2569 family protein [Pseudomonadota bacterium]
MTAPGKPLSGVRGWLLLVAAMLVLGPLIGAIRIGADLLAAEHQYPALQSLPRWEDFKAAMWCSEAVIAALSTYAGWGLLRERRWLAVRRAMLVLWLTGPAGVVVMGFVVPLLALGESSAREPLFISSLLASIVGAGIWTAYLARSRRVRNTYDRPG